MPYVHYLQATDAYLEYLLLSTCDDSWSDDNAALFLLILKEYSTKIKTPTNGDLSETDLGLACPEHYPYSFPST